MYALRVFPFALLLACGGSDNHETGESSAAKDEHASLGELGESTGSISTGLHHVVSEGSTGHLHEPTTGEHHESSTGASDDPVVKYCDCMVVNCHDEYHGTWGEEHPQSEVNCQAAAAMVPSVGAPATMGDSIECRIHYCEAALEDESACASAIGGGMCM